MYFKIYLKLTAQAGFRSLQYSEKQTYVKRLLEENGGGGNNNIVVYL